METKVSKFFDFNHLPKGSFFCWNGQSKIFLKIQKPILPHSPVIAPDVIAIDFKGKLLQRQSINSTCEQMHLMAFTPPDTLIFSNMAQFYNKGHIEFPSTAPTVCYNDLKGGDIFIFQRINTALPLIKLSEYYGTVNMIGDIVYIVGFTLDGYPVTSPMGFAAFSVIPLLPSCKEVIRWQAL